VPAGTSILETNGAHVVLQIMSVLILLSLDSMIFKNIFMALPHTSRLIGGPPFHSLLLTPLSHHPPAWVRKHVKPYPGYSFLHAPILDVT